MTEFNQNTFKTPAAFETAPSKKNFLPYVIFALALIIVAGGAYYFSLKNSAPQPGTLVPVAVTTPPTVTPTPTPTTAPVSVQDLQNAANSLNISTDSADLTDLNKDIQGL